MGSTLKKEFAALGANSFLEELIPNLRKEADVKMANLLLRKVYPFMSW